MPVDFIAYHDRTSADHKIQLDKFGALGYRLVSLSVYNTAQNPLYAGVMVKRANVVAQREFHDLNSAQIQQHFDEQAKQGFGPAIITGTGSAANPLFAAVFEPMSPIPFTRTALAGGDPGDINTFQGCCAQAKKDGLILRWAGAYGDANAPRYIGIWVPNPDKVVWNADGINDSVDGLQQRFNAQTSGRARPALFTVSPSETYLSLFVGNEIGNWVARHNMTGQGYQAEFDKWVKQGYFPLCVQAGGVGGNTRFAAIFTRQETPTAN